MKQITEKNKTIYMVAIIALIILIGIVVTGILGFNKELRYSESQRIDVYIEQKVDKAKIQEIVDEVIGKNNMVQTVEIYQDMVTIRAKSISEEQKNDIVNKIKENYEIEQTAEDTEIKEIPATRIKDMYKNYIIPLIISGIIVIIYMIIRYHKKGILKVLARTIVIPIISELLLLSIISITRIPIGTITLILVILIYLIAMLYVVKKCEE